MLEDGWASRCRKQAAKLSQQPGGRVFAKGNVSCQLLSCPVLTAQGAVKENNLIIATISKRCEAASERGVSSE
jgi:hypothetical protein